MNKSRILNIIIIILAVALIIFLFAKNKKTEDMTPVGDDTQSENGGAGMGGGIVVPTPAADSWKPADIDSDISFEIPETYYVSHPVIGECKDVTSISTQTATAPTVSIALVYKEGCITEADVTSYYSRREVREGYVFQTNSSSPSVLAIFDKIVASAKAK